MLNFDCHIAITNNIFLLTLQGGVSLDGTISTDSLVETLGADAIVEAI